MVGSEVFKKRWSDLQCLKIFCTRLTMLRNLHQPENLETILNEAAEATYRNSRVFGVFGHLKNDDQRLVVLSIDSHVVRYRYLSCGHCLFHNVTPFTYLEMATSFPDP